MSDQDWGHVVVLSRVEKKQTEWARKIDEPMIGK